jgi:SAM-dependent methyltransferase
MEIFDRVVAVTVLCFVCDAERAIAEMTRVLKPGGRLVNGVKKALHSRIPLLDNNREGDKMPRQRRNSLRPSSRAARHAPCR